MTAPAGGADRAMVLAWMQEMGKGYKAAAAHFGLPVERVKMWERRASRPPKVSPPPVKTADGPKGEGKQPPPGPVARAKDGIPAQTLSAQDRERLRTGVRGALEYLAEPLTDADGRPLKVDWRSRDAAARCLRNLLEVGVQVLTFDEATAVETRGGLSPEEQESADRMMLADVPPVGLTVVPGGKAATGS